MTSTTIFPSISAGDPDAVAMVAAALIANDGSRLPDDATVDPIAGMIAATARHHLATSCAEAANRLARRGVDSPEGVEWAVAVANRNFIIHRYDEISSELTWQTLVVDLPGWAALLSGLFELAEDALQNPTP